MLEAALFAEDETGKSKLFKASIITFENALTVWEDEDFPKDNQEDQRKLDSIRKAVKAFEL